MEALMHVDPAASDVHGSTDAPGPTTDPGSGVTGGGPPSSGSWLDRLPGGFIDAVALFFTLRIALGLVAAYLWWKGGLPGPCHFELARNGWLTTPPLADQGLEFPLAGVWQRWDACWYGKIATFGYEPAEMSANFWPLFPVLTGGVARVIGGSVAVAGLVVSAISYVAAMTGLFRLVARDFDPVTARRTVLILSIFPSAFFLFAPFTEALFLALAVWSIAMARERRWLLAGSLALLAALTRIQGVFLVLPLAWEALAAAGLTAWRPWREWRLPTVDAGALLRGGLASIGPLAGFVGFFAFSAIVAGETPLDTQDAWGGKQFFPPWEVVDAAWRWTLEHHDPLQFLNLALLVLFVVLLAIGLFRLPVAYSLFAIPQVALLATRIQPTPLTSTNRYLLVVFPAFVILALIPWRRARLAWAITSTLFLAVLLQAFLMGDYVA
jgi:Dolichyl-phosphate-mannose-protein mannosyltransferase